MANLPRRLETLRVLQSGNVTVDQSSYAMKIRRNPGAAFNPRWNYRRARFSSLSLGPAGAQLEIVARKVDDIAELKNRLDLSMNEPSWILERVTRLRKEVRGRLRHPTGVLKTSHSPRVEKPPTKPAAPATTAACPRGARGCVNQDPPPRGDGCDDAQQWVNNIIKPPPPKPRDPNAPAAKPRREWRVTDLPEQCAGVLASR